MNHSEKPAHEYLLTFSDLVFLIKTNKKKIFTCTWVFALLGLFYALMKPVEYEAKGTFKEKAKSQSGISNSLSAAFFMMADGLDSNALTIMRSRTLIEDLIKNQNLQGVIIKKGSSLSLIPLGRIFDNLFVEYAILRKLNTPVLNDLQRDFKIEQIDYTGEVPLNFKFKVISEERFIVADGKKSLEGTFGRSFGQNGYSFILKPTHQIPKVGEEYTLLLLPLERTAEKMADSFKIEADKNDKTLIKITYRNLDRKIAADNINALMASYQRYIECEHDEICKKQVDYLVQRQNEMSHVLEAMMQKHADDLSQDLSSTGFATSEKAMEFLAHSQHDLKLKLFTINLEKQRLERAKNEESLDSGVFSSLSNFDVINKIETEKRSLKQRADSLNLVLRNIPTQAQEFQSSFSSQLKDMEEIKKSLNESNHSLIQLANDEIPQPQIKLSDDTKYIFNAWRGRLVTAKKNLEKNPFSQDCQEDWEHCKTGFGSYLTNLNHFFHVYQRNIEERLAHQQAPLKEFQGINLNVAGDLYIAYNKELSVAESAATQHEFIINQLDEPNFEISSLSTILTDPLSLEMITRTSGIILALKDQDNRSAKEQERLNADLVIQKGFLKTHVQQSIALLKLQQAFLKEKIQRLQSLSLSLIQEEISILENQIKEYINTTVENLNQEKILIEKNLAELRREMSAFPQKWAAEQLIDQQMEINKNLVEEISKLVESKNISNNLEKLQSSPVDLAYPPIHPKSPHLLLLALIGAATGAFLCFCWILAWSIVEGVRVSGENLKAAGQYVCGTFSRDYQDSLHNDPLLDSDLSTLRRIMGFINSTKASNNVLLLEGNGPDYAAPLAELMHFQGLNTLILELRFNEPQNSKTGLLQYLEGKIQEPEILHLNGFDKISSGGICRYANELIGSPLFKDLLVSLQKKYDYILVSSSAKPKSAEAESLLDLFPVGVVTVTDESIQDLNSCLARTRSHKNQLAFIIR